MLRGHNAERIGGRHGVRRRDLLRLGALAGALLLPMPAFAKLAQRESRKTLKLYNLHTGESIASTFWVDGQYVPDSLHEIDKILRDHHTDSVIRTDHKLVELMFQIQNKLGTEKGLDVVCGYRSPATNAKLVREGLTHAAHSFHISGQAIDFRVPERKLRDVRKLAMELQAGGVGYYPRSDFLHVDVGPVRHW